MASPRDSLSTHDRGAAPLGYANSLIQGIFKVRSLHILGKTAEAGIVPPRIDGIAARVPQTTKPSDVTVTNSRFLEGARETIPIKLRIVPRAWDCANVDQLLYAVSKQQRFKFFDRSR